MSVIILDGRPYSSVYSSDREGPWKLYIYGKDSELHFDGIWFMKTPKYPEEGEIAIGKALAQVESAVSRGQEVRITDVGDKLVYHSLADGSVVHGFGFFDEITATG